MIRIHVLYCVPAPLSTVRPSANEWGTGVADWVLYLWLRLPLLLQRHQRKGLGPGQRLTDVLV